MLVITPINDVFVQIACDDDIAKELSDYFSFETPGHRFIRRNPRFKGWDGKTRLFKLRNHTIYRGLIPRVLDFAALQGYEVDNRVPAPDRMCEGTALDEFIAATNNPLELRDYQYAALRAMLNDPRGIIVSPTGSGKSYIMWWATELLGVDRTLIVVPTIGLVTQMAADLISYGVEPADIHQITGGKEKTSDARIFISTWQSIFNQPATYFKQFQMVMCDEVHGAKAKALTGLMEKCISVPYRYGFTGTLDNTEVHRLILEGLFGTVTKVATTEQLVKQHYLTPPRVIVCVLEYPNGIRQAHRHDDYHEEIDFLCGHDARTKFLTLMCRETKGPTLMLFQLVQKHGNVLLSALKSLVMGRKVWYIDGHVCAEDREAIRQTLGTANDILLASYGTTQLGINIPNLRNLMFAHPSKSLIRVLQSIGRILRLSEGKTTATIIDVVDDLRIGKHVNYAWHHAEERIKFYTTEGFPTVLKRINMETVAQMASPAAPAPHHATNGVESNLSCPKSLSSRYRPVGTVD